MFPIPDPCACPTVVVISGDPDAVLTRTANFDGSHWRNHAGGVNDAHYASVSSKTTRTSASGAYPGSGMTPWLKTIARPGLAARIAETTPWK